MINTQLEDFRVEIQRCVFCHDQCMSSSPEVIASSEQTLMRSRIATLLEALLAGNWEWSPEVAAKLFYAINDGIQYYYCIRAKKEDQHTEPYIRAARAEAVKRGLAPEPVMAAAAAFDSTGNLFGIEALPEAKAPGAEAPVLIYDAASLAKAPATVDACRKLLEAVDSQAGEAAIPSAGFVEFDLGLFERAEKAARAAQASLQAIDGSGPLVTPDAVLAYTLRVVFPEWGLALDRDVLHISEYLAGKLDGLTLAEIDIKAVNHDDWALARGLKVTEAPRQALQAIAGLDLVEPVNTGIKAETDGPLAAYPDEALAKAIAELRYEELVKTGADVVITSSPYGWANLSSVEGSVPVKDFCAFLTEALL